MRVDAKDRQRRIAGLWREWEAIYRERTSRSLALNQSAAAKRIPEAFRAYSGGMPYPLFLERGEGAYIYDVDGNRYIDYAAGWNSAILGWANEGVARAIAEAASRFGATAGEPFPPASREHLASLVCERVPGAEQVIYAVSGSEACEYALRLARASARKAKVLTFFGAYHGMYDDLLIGSFPSAGLPGNTAENVIVGTYNDQAGTERLIDEHKDDLAAVFVEPIMCVAGNIHQRDGFLQFLRDVTLRYGVLLVFDEIITGFRFAMGGGAEYYRITPPPDLLAMAKNLGGGLPLGAVGGRAEILQTPDVYAGNTHAANPICCAAAVACLEQLTPEVYRRMNRLGERLRDGLRSTVAELGLAIQVTGDGTNCGMHMTAEDVRDGETARRADQALQDLLRLGVMNRGINWSTRGFGLMAAFTESDVDLTIDAFRQTLLEMKPLLEEVAPQLVM